MTREAEDAELARAAWARRWPKAALSQLTPRRDGAYAALGLRVPPGNPAKAIELLSVGVLPALPEERCAALSEAELRGLRAAVAFHRDPSVGELEVELLRLALARPLLTKSVWRDQVARLAVRGAPFVLEVLVEGGGVFVWRWGQESWRIERRTPIGEPVAAFEALREHLTTLDPDAFAAARAWAERRRERAHEDVRAKLAYAFADEAWAREALTAALASHVDGAPLSGATLALLSVLPADDAAMLVREAVPRFSRVAASSELETTEEPFVARGIAGLAAHVFDHALHVGEAAVPTLVAVLDAAFEARADGALLRRVGLALSLFTTREAAEAMADELGRKDLDKLTTDYFRAHPELALACLSARASRKSKIAEHARTLVEEATRLLAARGPATVGPPQASRDASPIEASRTEVASREPSPTMENAGVADASELPAPLARVPWRRRKRVKRDADLDPRLFDGLPDKVPSLPRWLVLDALPPLSVASGRPLSAESRAHLVEMLRFADPETPYAGLAMVREGLERTSRVAFARALVASFRAADHRSEDFWPLRAMGALGGGDVLDDLAAALEATSFAAHEASAERAAIADGLRLTGRPEALYLLWSASHTLAAPYARMDVRTTFERILRGLEPVMRARALEAMPTHGLDRDGTCTLDDTQGVRAVVSASLEVHLRDAAGRAIALDLEKSLEARARALGASIARTRDGLLRWLEDRVLAEGDTLTRGSLATLAAHPIARPIATHLLFDVGGTRVRVAEDGSLATRDDEPLALEADHPVGLAHPTDLSADERRAWLELWASYELVFPFAQLDRPIATPEAIDRWLEASEGHAARADALERLLAREWVPEGEVTKRGRVGKLGRVFGKQVVIVELDPPLRVKEAALGRTRVMAIEGDTEAQARARPYRVHGLARSSAMLSPRDRTELLVDLARLVGSDALASLEG